MKKIVIVPGGFHPFHAGHMALYRAAQEAFPSADVFVAATDDTSGRPFPFKTKKFLAQQAGVPGNRFIRVKSPFKAEEITQMYDPDDTALIFVRSEKDAQKPPQAGGVKRDGTPAYLQPYRRNGLEPFSKQGYMMYLPTVQFGPGMTSATEIRAKWPDMAPEEKISLIKTLYPSSATKDLAAGKIVSIFDEIMGNNVQEQTSTGVTTTYQDGVTTRTVTPPVPSQPDPELVRQKDALSQELRAQGMTGAQILKDPRYRELSRRIRGIEEQNTVTQGPNKGKQWSPKTPGPTAPGFRGVDRGVPSPEDGATAAPRGYQPPTRSKTQPNLGGYNTGYLQKIVTSNKPVKGITPAQALEELRFRMHSTDPHIDAPSPEFVARYLQSRMREATLINDPDVGHQIRPDGGMGTWDETSLVSNLARKFASMAEMLKNKNYNDLEYVLYQDKVVRNMISALAQYQRFMGVQGKRPIARGREVDLGEDYIEE